MCVAKSLSPNLNQVLTPYSFKLSKLFQVSSLNPHPFVGTFNYASVYITVSKSGEIFKSK